MLTRDEIESFMDDSDDMEPSSESQTPQPSLVTSGLRVMAVTTRAQTNMMRHWQRSMRLGR